MKISIVAKAVLFLFILQTLLPGYILTGKVVSVTDGDTIKILTKDKTLYKIRLDGIDAPERSQAFGKKSKYNLSKLVAGRIADIHYEKEDRYGRTIGTVFVDGQDMNLKQIKDGYAWVYRKYCDRVDYYKAERYAKDKKLGLWYDKHPTPPWDFRHRK